MKSYTVNIKTVGQVMLIYIIFVSNVVSCFCMEEEKDIEKSADFQSEKYYAITVNKRYRDACHFSYFENDTFEYKKETMLMSLKDGVLRCVNNINENNIEDDDGWEYCDFISVKENCCPDKAECVHLNIPKEVKEIVRNTFYRWCIDHVNLQEGIEILGEYAFCDTTLRGDVAIPSTVKTIKKGCFGYCNIVEEIKFNEGLVDVGELCFAKCKNLKRVILPDSVKYIGDLICYKCRHVNEFKFPKSLEKFDEDLFSISSMYCRSDVFHAGLTIILPDDCVCKLSKIQCMEVVSYRLEIWFTNCKIQFFGSSILGITFKKCGILTSASNLDKIMYF